MRDKANANILHSLRFRGNVFMWMQHNLAGLLIMMQCKVNILCLKSASAYAWMFNLKLLIISYLLYNLKKSYGTCLLLNPIYFEEVWCLFLLMHAVVKNTSKSQKGLGTIFLMWYKLFDEKLLHAFVLAVFNKQPLVLYQRLYHKCHENTWFTT